LDLAGIAVGSDFYGGRGMKERRSEVMGRDKIQSASKRKTENQLKKGADI
jgi:hypothetical protein